MFENSNEVNFSWEKEQESFFFETVSSSLRNESFHDATLACNGKIYKVHKFVLSLCSKFFKFLFESSVSDHPYIIITDTSNEDIESLLYFMYTGSVNVSRKNITSIMNSAASMAIQGVNIQFPAVPFIDSAPSESPQLDSQPLPAPMEIYKKRLLHMLNNPKANSMRMRKKRNRRVAGDSKMTSSKLMFKNTNLKTYHNKSLKTTNHISRVMKESNMFRPISTSDCMDDDSSLLSCLTSQNPTPLSFSAKSSCPIEIPLAKRGSELRNNSSDVILNTEALRPLVNEVGRVPFSFHKSAFDKCRSKVKLPEENPKLSSDSLPKSPIRAGVPSVTSFIENLNVEGVTPMTTFGELIELKQEKLEDDELESFGIEVLPSDEETDDENDGCTAQQLPIIDDNIDHVENAVVHSEVDSQDIQIKRSPDSFTESCINNNDDVVELPVDWEFVDSENHTSNEENLIDIESQSGPDAQIETSNADDPLDETIVMESVLPDSTEFHPGRISPDNIEFRHDRISPDNNEFYLDTISPDNTSPCPEDKINEYHPENADIQNVHESRNILDINSKRSIEFSELEDDLLESSSNSNENSNSCNDEAKVNECDPELIEATDDEEKEKFIDNAVGTSPVVEEINVENYESMPESDEDDDDASTKLAIDTSGSNSPEQESSLETDLFNTEISSNKFISNIKSAKLISENTAAKISYDPALSDHDSEEEDNEVPLIIDCPIDVEEYKVKIEDEVSNEIQCSSMDNLPEDVREESNEISIVDIVSDNEGQPKLDKYNKMSECTVLLKKVDRDWKRKYIKEGEWTDDMMDIQKTSLKNESNEDDLPNKRARYLPTKVKRKEIFRQYDEKIERSKSDIPQRMIYRCPKCKFITSKRGKFYVHYKAHLNDSDVVLSCIHCNFQTVNHKILVAHKRQKHNYVLYECPECEFSSEWKTKFTKHLKEHYRKMFSCQYCEFQTEIREGMTEHLKVHSDLIHKCTMCSYTAYNEKNLTVHMRSHKSSTYFTCKICSFVTISNEELELHKGMHESLLSSQKMLKCIKCSFSTCNGIEFDRHKKLCNIKIRHKPKPIQKDKEQARHKSVIGETSVDTTTQSKVKNLTISDADSIDKSIKSKNSQSIPVPHENEESEPIHLEIQDLNKSDDAISTSTTKSPVHPHEKNFNKDRTKEYNCTRCDFKTDMWHDFKIHRNIHTGHAFLCPREDCKSFAKNKAVLISHLETHFDKVNTCPVCSEKLLNEKEMELHMQKFHRVSISVYQCLKCDDFCTFNKEKFRAHEKWHSGDDLLCPYPKCRFIGTSTQKLKFHIHGHEFSNAGKEKKIIKTDDGRIRCPHCPYSTFHIKFWRKHQRDIHEIGL